MDYFCNGREGWRILGLMQSDAPGLVFSQTEQTEPSLAPLEQPPAAAERLTVPFESSPGEAFA